MTALVSTEAFFAALFPNLHPDETIEIRPILADRIDIKHRRFCPDVATAARYALSLNGRHNVYFGVNARRDENGTKAGVQRVTAIHADVDDKAYPDGRAGALAALAAFTRPPSIVVDSGGGLQVFWLLTTAVDVTVEANRTYVESLLTRLYGCLGKLDPVQDISRVFRVPGTTNHKYNPPRPATIVTFRPEIRYTLSLIASALPAEASPAPQPVTRTSGTYKDDDTSADDVREMLRHIPPPPPGAYADWLAVLMAVHDACPGPEGVTLCEDWSPGFTGEIAQKFDSFKRASGTRVTVGTLVRLAKQHGWAHRPPTIHVSPPPKPPDPPPAPPTAFAALEHQSSPASATAAADEPCQQLAEENARLRQELAAAHQMIATLREERSLIFAVLRNPGLPLGVRLATLATVSEVQSQKSRGELDEHGRARIPMARLGEQTGGSAKRASANLDMVAEHCPVEKFVERQLVERDDPVTGKKLHRYESHIWVGLTASPNEVLRAAACVTTSGARAGGYRPPRCPDHPTAGVTARKTTVYSCDECGQILDRHDTTSTALEPLPMLASHYGMPTFPRTDSPPRGSTYMDGHNGMPTSLPALEIIETLKSSPIGELPSNERQGRPLTQLPKEEQPAAWQRAIDTAPHCPHCGDAMPPWGPVSYATELASWCDRCGRQIWQPAVDGHPASGHNGTAQPALFEPRRHDGAVIGYGAAQPPGPLIAALDPPRAYPPAVTP